MDSDYKIINKRHFDYKDGINQFLNYFTALGSRRYHEMPQKACERGFFHVIAISQFFEMPQNRRILFSVHFLF